MPRGPKGEKRPADVIGNDGRPFLRFEYRLGSPRLSSDAPTTLSPRSGDRAVEDGRRFLAAGGEQAEALGWSEGAR
jgi:hypothetical protein